MAHAAAAKAIARCDLPVPGFPTNKTFSRRSMNSARASSATSALFTEGRAVKSKDSKDFRLGKRAAFSRRSAALRSRSSSSSSETCSR